VFWLFSSLLSSQIDVLIKWHSGTNTLDGIITDVNRKVFVNLTVEVEFPLIGGGAMRFIAAGQLTDPSSRDSSFSRLTVGRCSLP
jgi:hypothetical protein